MNLATDDTICAIASAPGGAVRGIVRVSGPDAVATVDAIFMSDGHNSLDAIRHASAHEGHVRVDAFAAQVPCTLYLWPGTLSYTKSPMAEFHTIGSPPLLDAILATLTRIGARLAQPGEFTMRAFLAGRLDLTQAEAVLGVIDADNDRQLKTALRQMAGGLTGPLNKVRESLLNMLAELEAGLDFVEEDIEFISNQEVRTRLADAQQQVAVVRDQLAGRADSRTLARVTLVGLANVGKSTLFNAIVERTRATDYSAPSIVSDTPGTTRDYRTATINSGDIAWQLVDTAGVMHTVSSDAPTIAAQHATDEQYRDADLRVLCIDASRSPESWEVDQAVSHRDEYKLVIHTKADIAEVDPSLKSDLRASAATGEGIDDLLSHITSRLADHLSGDGDAVASTATRCRESLARVAECLTAAESLVKTNAGNELVVAELRIALDQLGQVVGTVYTDDILDRIFSRFCIGK